MEDKEIELQEIIKDIVLNHLDSPIILMKEQKKMLETMIYSSDSNPYLQHIDCTLGREPIQTIIDNGYYGIEHKEMLNNLRDHWVQNRRRRS